MKNLTRCGVWSCTVPDESPVGAFKAHGVVKTVLSRRVPHRGVWGGDRKATISHGSKDDQSQKSIKHRYFRYYHDGQL